MNGPRHGWLLAAVAALALASAATAQSGLDRSTPRRTVRGFVLAVRRGDEGAAASALDLGNRDPAAGTRLARQLGRVIDRALWLDYEAISDEPASDEGQRVVVAELPLGDSSVPLALVSVRDAGGGFAWVISSAVVARTPDLYAEHGPGWLERLLPPWMARYHLWELELWQLAGALIALVVALLAGRAAAWLLLRGGARLAARTDAEWDDALVGALRGPTRFVLAVVVGWALLEPLRLSARAQGVFDRLLQIGLIASLAWTGIRLVGVVGTLLERRAVEASRGEPQADLRLRGLRTQVLVLRRVVAIVIGIVAASLMLVQFDLVRSVGLSLLASAGMAGIVIGLAAQRSIATLLAGVQLSITQPIRLGDTVIVEGEWGWIEEINLTYVVVKVWDERRLVVPMTRFLDNPFQNWTKVSPQLLGTVFFHADHRLPIDDVRKELARILDGHPKWDGRAQGVVVTDAKERTIEVRALVSAKDAGDQWDLRCDVREKLVAWLRDHEGGAYLPRVRVHSRDERSPAAVDEE
jgi:small-conductance mechanosensitive channel